MVETLGFLIRGRVRALKEGGAETSDKEAAAASGAQATDDEASADAGEDAQTRSLLDALEERLRDSHAFVRMRVLQTYQTLIEYGLVPNR